MFIHGPNLPTIRSHLYAARACLILALKKRFPSSLPFSIPFICAFLQSRSFLSRTALTEPRLLLQTQTCIKLSDHRHRGSWKIIHGNKRASLGASFNGCVVLCCTSFSSSSPASLYLVSEYGWKVRRLEEDQDEIRKVAQIQAEAFHQPLAFFDDLFFQFFKAEVLTGLIYKLRNSPPNRYACLIAESSTDANSELQRKLVGVVDVTALRDDAVLQHLHGAEEYLYVSGLAVSESFRRRKIGSCLLKACEVVSVLWGFKYLVLRAYEDDFGARTLYANAGYRVVSGDPPWITSWIGRRRRVLMIKQCNFLNLI